MDWRGLGAAQNYIADAMRRGAQEIRERGWVQGRFVHEESGAIDVVQALGLATGIDVAASHRRDLRLPAGSCILLGAVLQTVSEHVRCASLAIWNDMPETDMDVVTNALETAATRLDT